MAFFEFPHTRTYDSDLGWLIKAFREISAKLDTYLENAVITFADPITWDITEQYTALTCVIDSDGTAYLSKQPVPAGVDISNTDYWLPIFNYDDNINELRSQIAYNAQNSNTTGVALSAGDLVFWNSLIYKVTADMPAGTRFIIGSNVEQYTVDKKINDAYTHIDSVVSGLEDQIEDVETRLSGELDAVSQSIDDRIEPIEQEFDTLSLYCYRPDKFGAAGDGVTDDSAAVQSAINACITDGRVLYLGGKTYACSGLEITDDITIMGGSFKAIPESSASNQYLDLFHADNVNVKFSDVEFIGLGDAVTNTATIYHFMKFTNSVISFDKCRWHDLHSLNTNLGSTAFPDRFGICLTAIDSDVTIINSEFYDMHREELIWICPSQDYGNKITFNNNHIHDIGGWSFDLFALTIDIEQNLIERFNSETSIFNVSGESLIFSGNKVIDSVYTNIIDTDESGYFFCDSVILKDNYCECADKSTGYNYHSNFANIRAYDLFAENNVYQGDYFINHLNNYLSRPSVVKWHHIGDYSINSSVIKNNTVTLGTGFTDGRGCIFISATAFTSGPSLSSALVKFISIEGNHIIYDTSKPYTIGYAYGVPFNIGSNVDVCNVVNNMVTNGGRNGYSQNFMLVMVRPVNTAPSVKQINIIGNYIHTVSSVSSMYLLYANNPLPIGSARIVTNAIGGYNASNATVNNYVFPSGFTLNSFKTLTAA